MTPFKLPGLTNSFPLDKTAILIFFKTFISSLFIEDNKPTSCGLIKLYLDKTILPFLISSPFFLTFFF